MSSAQKLGLPPRQSSASAKSTPKETATEAPAPTKTTVVQTAESTPAVTERPGPLSTNKFRPHETINAAASVESEQWERTAEVKNFKPSSTGTPSQDKGAPQMRKRAN